LLFRPRSRERLPRRTSKLGDSISEKLTSCLNYGYSIIRNTIIRALIAAGLLPAFGIHHKNLFNAFNLADDLIEPFRPSVDLISYYITGDTTQLDRSQRRKLAEVLLQAVRMNGRKVNIFTAINMMVDDSTAGPPCG